MTSTPTTEAVTAPRTTRRTSLGAALIVVASVAATCALAVRGSALVSGPAALHRVGFGWPMHWLFQDQRGLDPSYPEHTTVLSPWEYPVGVHLGALAADVLVVLAPLLIVWLVVRRSRSRESQIT